MAHHYSSRDATRKSTSSLNSYFVEANRNSTSSLDSLFGGASSSTSVSSGPQEAMSGAVPISRGRQHQRNRSAEHNVMMRELMAPWGALSSTPPQCQSIMYASWSRFNPSRASSKSSDELKLSALLVNNGTTPDFNPPIYERVYLGVDQTVSSGSDSPGPQVRQARRGHGRGKSSLSNSQTLLDEAEQEQEQEEEQKEKAQTEKATTPATELELKAAKKTDRKKSHGKKKTKKSKTMDSQAKGERKTERISFGKSPIRTTPTNSLLTTSFRAASVASTQKRASPASIFAEMLEKQRLLENQKPSKFGQALDKQKLSASELPSAFDSDSEDDGGATQKGDPIDHLTKKLGKQMLSASMLPSAFDSDSEEEEGVTSMSTLTVTARKYRLPVKALDKKLKLTASMLPSAFDSDSEDDMMGLKQEPKAIAPTPKATKPTWFGAGGSWEDVDGDEDENQRV